MSHKIATSILEEGIGGEGERREENDVVSVVLSTTVVLLGLSTASLGAVLILMGKFRLADVVAYLPLPGKSKFIETVRSKTMLDVCFLQHFTMM